MCQYNKTHKIVYKHLKQWIKTKYPHLIMKSLKKYKEFLNNTIESSHSDRGANSSIDSAHSETSAQLTERMRTPWVADSIYSFQCLI